MTIIMLGFLLAIKVKNPLSSAGLPLLTGEELKKFTDSPQKSVVFFGHEFQTNMQFADYGIWLHKKDIKFCVASLEDGEAYGVTEKSAIAFQQGVRIQTPLKATEAGLFLRWLNVIKDNENYEIKTGEELRGIMNIQSSTIFNIGLNSIPDEYSSQQVFRVKQSVFSDLGIPGIDNGLYIYRPCDRQLLKIESKLENYDQCKLTQYNSFDPSLKPFSATFVLEGADDSLYEKHYQLLNHISDKFADKLFAFALPVSALRQFKTQVNVERSTAPFFVIYNNMNNSAFRYIYTNEKGDLFNEDAIDAFIQDVIDGKIEPTVVSKPLNELNNFGPLKEVSTNLFKELVLDSKDNVLVAFTAPWCHHCKVLKPVLNATAHVLKNTPNKIYFFDVDANDMPNEVPELDGYPTIFLWGGKEHKPIQYEERRSVGTIIGFLSNNTATPFELSEYNETEILEIYRNA